VVDISCSLEVYAQPALSADGEKVLVGSGDGNIYAWNYFIGPEQSTGAWGPLSLCDSAACSIYSSATIDGTTAYVGVGAKDSNVGAVHALSTIDGKPLWVYNIDIGQVWASPTVRAGVVYAAAQGGSVHAISAINGTKIWATPLGTSVVASPAVSPDGSTVYAAVEDAGGGGHVYALAAATGAQLWNVAFGGTENSVTATALVLSSDGGTLFVGSGASACSLYALDTVKEAMKWANGLPLSCPSGSGLFTMSKAVLSPGSETLYVNVAHTLHAVKASTATPSIAWSQDLGSNAAGPVQFQSPPVLNKNGTKVYIGSGDGSLREFNAATGVLNWQFPTGSEVLSAAALNSDESLVYIGSSNQFLYAVHTGVPLFESRIMWEFYESLGGASWTQGANTSWAEGTDPCNWAGTKDAKKWASLDCSAGRVIKISFINANLRGALPASLGEISQLQELDLFNGVSTRTLGGTLPESLGNLSNLHKVSLSSCNFTGTIPQRFGSLTSLVALWLDDNKLTGTLPDFPAISGGFYNLHSLHADKNQLTGTIPVTIGNLGNLAELHLQENLLSGPLPSKGLATLVNHNSPVGGCLTDLNLGVGGHWNGAQWDWDNNWMNTSSYYSNASDPLAEQCQDSSNPCYPCTIPRVDTCTPGMLKFCGQYKGNQLRCVSCILQTHPDQLKGDPWDCTNGQLQSFC